MEVDGLLSMACQAAVQMPYLKAMEIWSPGIGEDFFFRYEVGTSEVKFTVGATWNLDVAAWQTTRRQKSVRTAWERVASRHAGHRFTYTVENIDPSVLTRRRSRSRSRSCPSCCPSCSFCSGCPAPAAPAPAPGPAPPVPTAPAIFTAAAAARAAGDPAVAAVFLEDARERARREALGLPPVVRVAASPTGPGGLYTYPLITGRKSTESRSQPAASNSELTYSNSRPDILNPPMGPPPRATTIVSHISHHQSHPFNVGIILPRVIIISSPSAPASSGVTTISSKVFDTIATEVPGVVSDTVLSTIRYAWKKDQFKWLWDWWFR
ncbi:hypothetical protein CMUS01_16493 [Colletotrichum musicola]|uniref:DUF6546 domain-containing protein n=1 Tax=Colletotrichum musicola TaxID=2175873 RepID=A0A8H6IMP7_9PEZI|nr:hypothetical protein CMUS01_16493 [Colletotrichum musicola]